ncbi:MAG: putative baseplate assembly protein [Vicinamibacterales bacterium]
MPLPPPPVALLSYRQLVREALERVPSHTPEWTNLNDADPGVTIVQLFAFIAETLSYRADLIPERNRRKFLQLLDVPLLPAQPAQGLVTFGTRRGPLTVTTLPGETEVTAGRVPYRTRDGLQVLPIEGRLYYKASLDAARQQDVERLYTRLYGDLTQAGARLDFYETRPFNPPETGVTLPHLDLAAQTTDGAMWLALLAREGESPDAVRPVIANQVLTLAVLPALDETSRAMPARRAAGAGVSAGLSFDLPRLVGTDVVYDRLDARPSADLALHPGTVELRLPGADRLAWREDLDPLEPGVGELPPTLAESQDGERLITWIRVRTPQGAARLSGIWINGSEVTQRAWVAAESLPAGTGEPGQRVVLAHTPVLPDTLILAVNGERWQRVDDLFAAGPEIPQAAPRLAGTAVPAVATASSRAFTLDPESGEIRCGDGFHGMRWPRGSAIVASYAYGGGRQGVVGIGAITRGPSLPAGMQVVNPAPTWGGSDAESVTDAEHRIPRWLRHRDRLVTEEDFREIVWATPGVELGRVDVLPLYHPRRAGVAPGVVTLLLVPLFDATHPDNPEPDRLFLEAVCRHLEPRRLVTTELFLTGPEYRDLIVSVGVDVVPGQDQGPVIERAGIEVRRFLSPLAGGFEGRGWPLDKDVDVGEVLAAVARVPGIARVNGLLLGNISGGPIANLSLGGVQLPRVAGVSVVAGDPVPLSEVAGAVPTGAPPETRRIPVPVIPEEC